MRTLIYLLIFCISLLILEYSIANNIGLLKIIMIILIIILLSPFYIPIIDELI
ncbi:MAG: hypothetical protein N4A50_11300 [Vallitalea sp.]|jgi:hypothetical protein|nr:hypothetical protein [Vallitalea sp.]